MRYVFHFWHLGLCWIHSIFLWVDAIMGISVATDKVTLFYWIFNILFYIDVNALGWCLTGGWDAAMVWMFDVIYFRESYFLNLGRKYLCKRKLCSNFAGRNAEGRRAPDGACPWGCPRRQCSEAVVAPLRGLRRSCERLKKGAGREVPPVGCVQLINLFY